MGKTVCEKTSLLPRSCASSRHLALVGVSGPTCQPPATGKGSLTCRVILQFFSSRPTVRPSRGQLPQRTGGTPTGGRSGDKGEGAPGVSVMPYMCLENGRPATEPIGLRCCPSPKRAFIWSSQTDSPAAIRPVRRGTTYAEATIRTMISAHLCTEAVGEGSVGSPTSLLSEFPRRCGVGHAAARCIPLCVAERCVLFRLELATGEAE